MNIEFENNTYDIIHTRDSDRHIYSLKTITDDFDCFVAFMDTDENVMCIQNINSYNICPNFDMILKKFGKKIDLYKSWSYCW